MLVYFFKHLPRIFLIIDYIIINCLFIFGKLYFFEFNQKDFAQEYRAQLLLLNISWFVITIITQPYKSLKIKESSLHFNALAKSFSLLILTSVVFLLLVFSVKINYKNIILYFLLLGFFMPFTRFLLFLYRKKNRVKLGRKLYSFNTVLVGENKLSVTLLSNNDLRRALRIRGTYTLVSTETKNKYLGRIEKLFHDLETTKINSIIFCDNDIDVELYKQIVEIAEHKMIRIYMVPDFKYANLGPNYFDIIHEIPFLKLIREPLSNPKKQLLKRIFDIGFSFFVMVFLLSWLIPIIALIVKIESNESVFFMQKRSGLNNEPFNCIKFRSMKSNGSADIQTAKKNDARVTKFGAFIRKTSIDELPQFINVFLGDMSIVGPRPHMLSQTEVYSKITKKYMTRHIVKPGITGWAQVMGARGEIFSHRDMERRIEKDVWYIQNWSFFLDMKIIFLTLYNIVKGDEQAY
ncbi:exopolysaccharide biosynthesis polyprenyl glycosylphosphotransferase [Chryseobacterium balustinum]|uniref:Colanic acid biosysnthesis UDP-glucose lipid carrier transferase n=1 Tax=Chryseobacterium balustinum TaxID=246 RepID=A0AAX2IRL6_9FLAO|nr:exopolysaccharide biosynthesis polyprenyl glycosylphosphotransferase [Chryseobacterium balustinum]AZB28271.1 exopolysaccharide biosynthesis polyprenyl glycosylphosphotransferase [Chryseobacterium balustinum]SKB90001.1 putative colanic acid biosysnthesis UDP-glucose lipid carrier transferase [Chryseobacterium balustinum]SQA92298.1 Putative colanic biosynthesis UDP-glucose lipid carrier transferase [Chryseobacterium balustinum]